MIQTIEENESHNLKRLKAEQTPTGGNKNTVSHWNRIVLELIVKAKTEFNTTGNFYSNTTIEKNSYIVFVLKN